MQRTAAICVGTHSCCQCNNGRSMHANYRNLGKYLATECRFGAESNGTKCVDVSFTTCIFIFIYTYIYGAIIFVISLPGKGDHFSARGVTQSRSMHRLYPHRLGRSAQLPYKLQPFKPTNPFFFFSFIVNSLLVRVTPCLVHEQNGSASHAPLYSHAPGM